LFQLLTKNSDDKSDIVVGGIITFMARKFGVDEESGINKIEENIRLNLETLASMFFLKPYGYSHNFQYEWKVNRANCLIIQPNPDITNPEVMKNLLYVGTNPHVQDKGDDGGDEEEEGAHLHHEQEAGGHYDDERWALIQTKIQRISTEKRRQGVEMVGLRNDVQRGNRMNEENNQML